jgi:putative nucleotidyltransferase with HDIG domain
MAVGNPIPREGTYCDAMLDGRLPNVVKDSRVEPVVCNLPLTKSARIGSYIGVPVVLPTGETYGTFCCVSHDSNPDLRDRDVQFMQLLARLIGDQLQREEQEVEGRRLAVRAGNVTALLAALAARDGYTQAHSEAVVALALSVGRTLGVAGADLCDLENAALLHDIGKIGISDTILQKPGSLTDEEWDAMRRHSEIGAEMVASMEPLAHLAGVIRAEHERWDGTGYPDGLKGEEIPLAARIIFVCDAYHAMTSDRPYRTALSHEVALAELSRNAGTQFCPATVAAALATITEAAAA